MPGLDLTWVQIWHCWSCSASEPCGTCGSLVMVASLNLLRIFWSWVHSNAVDFFSSGDVSGSVVCLHLGVAVRGFLSGGDFLALLSWVKSLSYRKRVGGFTFVSASAFSVTKFVSLVTIVLVGLSVSGFFW